MSRFLIPRTGVRGWLKSSLRGANRPGPLVDLSTYAVHQLPGDSKLQLAILAMKNISRPDQPARIDELMTLGGSLPAEYQDGLEYL
jgi:hypothetical protein